jgi:hypothetical protein
MQFAGDICNQRFNLGSYAKKPVMPSWVNRAVLAVF